MTQCPKCGTENPSQARFCRSCGTKLSAEAQTPPAVSPTVSPEQRAQRLLEEAFRQAEQGRTLAAIQTCQQAIAINPNSTSAHSLLGTLYERQGDREKAIRAYEQVLSLSPDSTVERRRLNELMGVPAAREGVSVSPRVARMVISGAFIIVIAVVGVAVMLTTSQPARRPTTAEAPPLRRVTTAAAPVVATAGPALPAPGQMYGTPMVPQPPIPALGGSRVISAPRAREPQAPAVTAAPNTYAATGATRYYGSRQTPALSPVPMAGAVAYRGGAPVVSAPPRTTFAWPANPQAGQGYYLRGEYRRAAEAYRSYLQQEPAAGGAAREELAWVYTEMGERGRAQIQYRDAINHYQADIERGVNTEAARHGLRTCEAAIRALEAR